MNNNFITKNKSQKKAKKKVEKDIPNFLFK